MILEKYHLVKRFINQAQLLTDKEALRFKKDEKWQSISWNELYKIVTKLAHSLIHNQISEQKHIGIFSQNTPQWTMIDFAAVLARAVAVPIYATNTAEQARFVIENAEIEILFVGGQEQYQKAIRVANDCPKLRKIVAISKEIVLQNDGKSVYFDDFIDEPSQTEVLEKELQRRINNSKLSDIYTIIYTSGTTGTPKGVLIDFENVASQLQSHDQALKVNGGVSLSFLPLTHVYERMWVAYVLHKGVVNCYLEDTNKIAEALKEVKPDYMCVVPRLLEKIYTKIYENVTRQPIFKRLIFALATRTGKQMLKARLKNRKPSWLLSKIYDVMDRKIFVKLREAMGGNLKIVPCGGATLEPSIGRFFQFIGINVKLGYGMTETSATVSCWGDDSFHLKSVGKILPSLQVKIGENNEILVKGGSVTKGYYKNPQETEKLFTSDGFLRTGDAGSIDKHGNLFITERIKELMKTSNGKYIAPQQIEGKIGKDSFIDQLAVIADMRNFVSALIVPNFEALTSYANDINLKYKNYSDLIKNHQIVEMFEKRLQKLQKELPSYEQIKKFTLLVNPFSIEKEELTPTLKLKRKNIYKNYRKEIEAMYI